MRGVPTASAGFDREWQKIPKARLHPKDLYHMIDWVRDGWDDDELFVTPRLQRLKWHLEELPLPWRDQGLEQYATLCRARIVAGVPWKASIATLGCIVSDWSRDRRYRDLPA